MKKYSIIISLAVLLGLGGGAKAQNGFNIPFSQYGIGSSDLPFSHPNAYRMGGVVFSRSSRNTINPFNPASYAAVETESFVFDIGVNIQSCVLRDDAQKQTDADGNMAYITIAFPITKWLKMSAGILPFSSVNYESTQTHFDPLTLSDVKTIYAGNGGVTQYYWGSAFNIGKRLSLGFNLNYLGGSITRAITYNFQGNDSTYCVNSRRQKDTYVSNLLIDLGLQYHQLLGEQYTMHLGATCRLPRNMQISDEALVYTFYGSTSSEYLFDTIFPLRGTPNNYLSQLEQPLAIGVGLSLERNNLWEVAVDGYYAPYSGQRYIENPDYNIFGSSALREHPNYRIAFGGEWKGDADAGSYWKRIGISAGAYYNSSRLALEVANQLYTLDEIGGGMGFSLPMRKGRSVLTLSVGYSSFGNTALLRRDCLTFGLTIGSCERWFVKRKYN
ncbi:MAG: hypothetical protein IKH33_10085 [Bacteroidales bacterium]|nr:hypothetical protein [Bacteroidales bacterium]